MKLVKEGTDQIEKSIDIANIVKMNKQVKGLINLLMTKQQRFIFQNQANLHLHVASKQKDSQIEEIKTFSITKKYCKYYNKNQRKKTS